MNRIFFLLVFLMGCSSDDPFELISDMESDFQSTDVSKFEDVGRDLDTGPGVRPETCRQNTDCWRGNYCSGGRCNGLFGCKPATLPPPDIPEEPRGCWYEHGEEHPVNARTGGLGTARECEADVDCKNPSEPHCVVFVCHHNPSCGAGPCPAGTTCIEQLDYCLDD